MTSHLIIFIVPDDQIWIAQVQQMGHKTCSVVGLERWIGERWTASRVKSMVDQIRGRIVHNVHNVHNAQEVHVAKSQARPPHIHTTHTKRAPHRLLWGGDTAAARLKNSISAEQVVSIQALNI